MSLNTSTAHLSHSTFSHDPLARRSAYDAWVPETPSPTDSPESSYSMTSPNMHDGASPAFEFDHEDNDHQLHDIDVFDRLRHAEGIEGEGEGGLEGAGMMGDWNDPAWANWSEMTRQMNASWNPTASRLRASIISISPRGSLGQRRGSERLSLSASVPKIGSGLRRESDPTLLGFNLATFPQRRRSSTKSATSSLGLDPFERRRSSVYSTGSAGSYISSRSMSMSLSDPLEIARLRNIASMDLLRRRFSEVVEVTSDSDSDAGEQPFGDIIDRRRRRIRIDADISGTPSSLSESSFGDDTDIHTASYDPTPELRSGFIPSVYSNFPLESVAVPVERRPSSTNGLEGQDSASDLTFEIAPSPLYVSRLDPPTPRVFNESPTSADALAASSRRPQLSRSAATSDARAVGLPPMSGLGFSFARPSLIRSISNPLLSRQFLLQSTDEEPITQPPRAIAKTAGGGSFPLARPTPLGVSPLRESLRRQSVLSDAEGSRRASFADGDESAVTASTLTMAKDSLRRMSEDMRRSSISIFTASGNGTEINSRKSSVSAPSALRRPSAEGDLRPLRESRESSLAIVREHGYLASEISIETLNIAQIINQIPTPTPPVSVMAISGAAVSGSHTGAHLTAGPGADSTKSEIPIPRLRSKAPPPIVLPTYKFPAHPHPTGSPTNLLTSTCTPGLTPTPRFNAVESFFGSGSASGGTRSMGGIGSPDGAGSGELLTPRVLKNGFSPLPSILANPRDLPSPSSISPGLRESYSRSDREKEYGLSPEMDHNGSMRVSFRPKMITASSSSSVSTIRPTGSGSGSNSGGQLKSIIRTPTPTPTPGESSATSYFNARTRTALNSSLNTQDLNQAQSSLSPQGSHGPHGQRPVIRARSITFLDPEPPRHPRMDRKSSFTRFFQAIKGSSATP